LTFETIECICNDKGESRTFSISYDVFPPDEDDFICPVSVKISELFTDSNTDTKSDARKEICRLCGFLIMGSFISDSGYEPHVICDGFSQDLEYCWSALSDPSISDIYEEVDNMNVLYIDTISLSEEYNNSDGTVILTDLFSFIIDSINDSVSNDEDYREPDKNYFVDLIAYYPEPLPYDDSMKQKQTDISCGIVFGMHNAFLEKQNDFDECSDEFYDDEGFNDDSPEISISIAPELCLRAMGMRVSGDTYPEEAKNRAEWDVLETAGWHECGNSRLLYKTFNDD
jgi:hypothetical protein